MSNEIRILCWSSVILVCPRLILPPYRLIIVRDVQQHFSSREDEALLQDYNLSFFYYSPVGGCAAGGGNTTLSSIVTETLQVLLSTDEGNGRVHFC